MMAVNLSRHSNTLFDFKAISLKKHISPQAEIGNDAIESNIKHLEKTHANGPLNVTLTHLRRITPLKCDAGLRLAGQALAPARTLAQVARVQVRHEMKSVDPRHIGTELAIRADWRSREVRLRPPIEHMHQQRPMPPKPSRKEANMGARTQH